MFKEELGEKAALAEQIIKKHFPKEQYPSVIYESMRYSLFAGGKRIRPILVREAALLVGGCGEDCEYFEAAVEMLHTYSLIHDDLPCMDDDDLRRGRPTNHRVYGEAIALLAGDALLNLAYETVFKGYAESRFRDSYIKGAKAFSEYAGVSGMIGGQVCDITEEGKTPNPDTLYYIHEHKTAALIKGALLLGGYSANARDEQIRALEDYGEAIGLMFQIVDDVLDVVGDREKLGKNVGTDSEHSKMTYPHVFGLEKAAQEINRLYEQSIDALCIFGEKAAFLKDLSLYLKSRQS